VGPAFEPAARMRRYRIGAGQGFYGDSPGAALDMARHGEVSAIAFDALSELTLAILQKDRQRDPSLGYTRDLGAWMKRLLPIALDRRIALITNAGGLNPEGAAEVVRKAADGRPLRVATVHGDNLTERLGTLAVPLDHAVTGAAFGEVSDRVVFAAAYLGAGPLVEALSRGADVVVTGRVADSALFLAPLVHALGWAWDDWDRLAAGTVVGHLLECSGQACGGNFSGDWASVPEPWHLGYPLAEVSEDGVVVIGKPPGSGGRVTAETVSEQLLYEVQDPTRYVCPDVCVDFTDVGLRDLGDNRVEVEGTRGAARPELLKVVIGYSDGWMGEGRVGYCWPHALKKARRAEEILRHRLEMVGCKPRDILVEFQGYDSLQPPRSEPDEVYLRVAVRTETRAEAEAMTREMPYLALNGPPGLGGYGGVTPPRELLGIWPTLVPREIVERDVHVEVT